jgi:hypothetical protein
MDMEILSFYYYPEPHVESVSPKCGPLTGFTQLAIKGDNFTD